jgi:hypothetical protein
MCEKEVLRRPLPINKWPEIERRMAIMTRMTADPPPKEIHLVTAMSEKGKRQSLKEKPSS